MEKVERDVDSSSSLSPPFLSFSYYYYYYYQWFNIEY